jgi:hypothetical protein
MFGGVLFLLCNVKNPTKHYTKEKNPTKHYIKGKEPHQTLHRRKRTPGFFSFYVMLGGVLFLLCDF